MKKIILAGREGFGQFEDTLYFDFGGEPFAKLIGFRWLEDTASGGISDCSDVDGEYIEKINEIISAEKENALDCNEADYRQVYYVLYGFELIDYSDYCTACRKYDDSADSDQITGRGREYFWSVESERNSYEDDEYNGNYNECVEYAKQHGYTNYDLYAPIQADTACQISFIQSDDGKFTECIDTIHEWKI